MYDYDETSTFDYIDSGDNRSNENSAELQEDEEIADTRESGVLDGLVDSDDTIILDYKALTASIRDATPVTSLDTDLEALQVTDICLLLVLLILGIVLLVRC